ncbi:MAG: TetR/AcrR family transcriptional regulator [Alphaproteobacteria bacterium]|nr:TetR/AcrR family transcriptional regulator [Alphaproteobacteria bacterium]
MATANKIVRLREEATRRIDKRNGKKRALAEHTLSTLSQLGYARTSLRDIAEQSGVSVGILHYYFEDKAELILCCVQLYKEEFLAGLEVNLKASGSPQRTAERMIDVLVASVENDAEKHRLWYDIRSQALFDDSFTHVVSDLENSMIDFCGRLLDRVELNGLDPLDLYLRFDALFRYYLQRKLNGDRGAPRAFRDALSTLLRSLGT